jgi:hypothetical protein
MSTCKNFDYCVERALEYARRGDYTSAIMSFMSDTSKFDCTKSISQTPLSMYILNDSCSSIATFENALREFSVCNCECNK